MTDQPIKARKAALRSRMREHRAALSARIGQGAAEAVADHLATLLEALPESVVSAYWPLDGELDPRPGLSRLAALGHAPALPRMRGRDLPLAFHRWHPDDPLIEGRFSVMEPAADAPDVVPAVVLVPLLAFDGRGHRLGYGKGFYDRTLAALRARAQGTLAIGLGFAAQEVDEVPADGTDERLDAVVSEDGTRRIAPDLDARVAAAEPRA